jgi:hypothetical protein
VVQDRDLLAPRNTRYLHEFVAAIQEEIQNSPKGIVSPATVLNREEIM